MKRKIIVPLATALVILGSLNLSAAGVEETYLQQDITEKIVNQETSGTISIQSIPDELTAEEYEGLLLMREEEKLARDVYLTLGELWDAKVFINIARSEQKHMDSVLTLLERYGIEDPIADDSRGIFNDSYLQSLYNTLIAQGSESYREALTVGATIEDLDIKDLQELLSQTDLDDISSVYTNLLKGSENHIRAFTKQLSRYHITYEAQFISDAELAAILGN